MSKQLKLIFALLHLCLAYNIGAAQQLQLKISSSDPVETTLINTISYSNTFEDYKTLEAEVYALKKQLLQQGFIETQILQISKQEDLVVAQLSLGQRYESIHLYAEKSLFEFLELDDIKNLDNSPYYIVKLSALENFLETLTSNLSAKSYPFARVALKNISPIEASTLGADLSVITKKARQLHSIKIKGYEKFPKAFIKHYLGIKPNTPID